jgi:hypothetical protein
MTEFKHIESSKKRWLQYQTDDKLNRSNLTNCINKFICQFTSDDLKKSNITDTDIHSLRQIGCVLSSGLNLQDFSYVEIDFTKLANTLVGKYFIRFFITDDINTDLSKDDFYNYYNIDINLC